MAITFSKNSHFWPFYIRILAISCKKIWQPCHGFSLFISDECALCVCRALSLSALYSVSLLGITFQIESLLMEQYSRRNLCVSKNPRYLRSQVI